MALQFLNNGYFAGKVGIGTDNPYNKTHIKTSVDGDGLLLDYAGSNNKYVGVFFKIDNNTSDAYKKGALVWERTGGYNEGRFHFLLNNDDNASNVDLTDSKVTILSTGNVGIGTTSPGAKLEVVGSAIIDGGTGVSSSGVFHVRQNGDGSSNGITITSSNAISHRIWKGANGTLNIGPSTAVSSFVQTLAGNVGIGTTSPSAKLNIESPLNSDIAFRLTQTSKNWWEFKNTGGTNDLNLSDAFGTYVTFKNGGNVGIGTTSPSEKLDVVGNIELNGVLYIGSRGIYQQENTDVSGLELVANASTSLYRAAFFDYVIQKTGNVRAGTVFACNDGGSVEYTETSTNDIGDTSDVVLSVDISGGNMRLLADAATSGWSVKSLIRAI